VTLTAARSDVPSASEADVFAGLSSGLGSAAGQVPLALVGLDQLSRRQPVLTMPSGVHRRPRLLTRVVGKQQQFVHGPRSPGKRRE
jgi:hypothetical protein